MPNENESGQPAGNAGQVPSLEKAALRKRKRVLWPSLVIVALVGIVGFFVAYDQMKPRERITVWFSDIHGLRVGSPVEHLGDQVGEVVEIAHPDDLSRRRIVIELVPDATIVDRVRRQGNSFYISRFASDNLQLKGVTKVIRGPSIVLRLGDPSAPPQSEFEGSQELPPDPRVGWNSVRTTVHFPWVYRLPEGAVVADRGTDVGIVEEVTLDHGSGRVKVRLAFFETDPERCPYVRESTRYFINNWRLTTKGPEGDASTALYGAHIAVVPDTLARNARIAESFQGNSQAPPEHLPQVGEKQVVLDSATWVSPDTPVFYRGNLAGYVHSVRQASDSNSFYAVVRIYPGAVPQVCEKTVFFFQKKLRAQLFSANGAFDWQGPRFEIPDPQLLLRPAIEFRTPTDSGNAFGFDSPEKPSFQLHAEPKDEWLQWTSSIAIEERGAPDRPQVRFPRPVSAKFHYRKAWQALVSWRKHEGLTLPVPGGVIALKELVEPEFAESDMRKVTFEIAGLARPRGTPDIVDLGGGIRHMRMDLQEELPRCPLDQLASIDRPVDIWVVTDPDHPKAIAAAKLRLSGDRLTVASDAGFHTGWHGAPVLCRDPRNAAYGKVIGLFVVAEDGKTGAVALLAPDAREKL